MKVAASDLLTFEPETPITEKGLRLNINVAIQYIGAWLAGQGAVALLELDAEATAALIAEHPQVFVTLTAPQPSTPLHRAKAARW